MGGGLRGRCKHMHPNTTLKRTCSCPLPTPTPTTPNTRAYTKHRTLCGSSRVPASHRGYKLLLLLYR